VDAHVVGAVAGEPVDLVDDAVRDLVFLTYWIIRISSGRSALRADSPASMNSSTTIAPSWSALRRFASRCAGIEKPSSRPPFSACSLVETRR
jgi:hypothetical protein